MTAPKPVDIEDERLYYDKVFRRRRTEEDDELYLSHIEDAYPEALDEIERLRARVAELEKSAVPPYVSCGMCDASSCCDGEWTDGSEVRCSVCGETGEITAFSHDSGHTFWVLIGLEFEEEDQS